MHIPDGFLNLPVLVSTGTFSAAMLGFSAKKVSRNLTAEKVPLLGLLATFVFTAQMFSFPVFGGTSVHISGSLLAAIILGPFSGFIVTSSAVILQGLLFQHGGILTIGANILNIAFIQSFLGYYLFKIFPKRWFYFALFISVLISKTAASAACATELILSGTIPLKAGMVSMISAHIIAGVIEGAVSIFILSTIKKLAPAILEVNKL